MTLFTFIPKAFAQSSTASDLPTQSAGKIGGPGLGPYANITTADGAVRGITGLLSGVIGFMTTCAGIWFLFQFIIGGFYWITAGGDKGKLEQSRDRITNAIVGLLVVVAAYAILTLTGYFTGIDFTITDINKFLGNIGPKP